MTIGFLIVGPARHGVTMLAARIAAALPDGVVVAADQPDLVGAAVAAAPTPAVRGWHVHFTDQLFGADCHHAATNLERLIADVTRCTGAPTSITLHDVPLDTDDAARLARRATAYRRVAAAATGSVIVNSEFEAAALARLGGRGADAVIPLPIDVTHRPAPAAPFYGPVLDIALLGFLYPGKGHQAAIDAAAGLSRPARVLALGAVAAGHDDLATALHRHAARVGVEFEITGFIPSDQLVERLRDGHLPVAANEQVSASGSIGSWIAAGRRPLVRDSGFARELERRCPATLLRYGAGPTGLVDALEQAVADPASSWLGPAAEVGPSTDDVAHRYRYLVPASMDCLR